MENEKKLVVIVGTTGAGKSSFINSLLGEQAASVSSGQDSCTEDIKEFQFDLKDGLTVSLVDTPGFNHYVRGKESKSDDDILKMITEFRKPRPVVAVTTRWDEIFGAGSQDSLQEAEEIEESLLQSTGFLKELNDARVQFLRMGHFGDNAPGDQYQSPLTIVKRLLGLEAGGVSGQEQEAEGEADQEHDAGAEEHAAEGEEVQEPCDTDPQVPANVPEPFNQDLGGCMEHIRNTLADLQSATNSAKLERIETNEDLKKHIGELLSKVCPQWKDWEDQQKSLIADQLILFGAKQELELKDSLSELKQALKISQKEREELQTLQEHERKLNNDLNDALLKASDLQTDKVALLEELNKVKSALAEQTTQLEIIKMENGSIYTSGLRSQLEELKNYRDLVNASRLETELELERTREAFKGARQELETQAFELARLREQVQAKTSESELHTQRIASLETELEEGKKRSEELAEESTRQREQAQAQTIESERRIQQITSLESELDEEKKKSEELVQESTRLRDQLQAKTTESELHMQRITSLETELAGEKRNSEEQAQEFARLKKRAQAKATESEQYRQRVASLEKDVGEWKKQAQESTRLRKQLQDKTANGNFSTDRIASLQLELKQWQNASEEQTRELTRLMKELQNKTAEDELHVKRITSLEADLEEWKQSGWCSKDEDYILGARVVLVPEWSSAIPGHRTVPNHLTISSKPWAVDQCISAQYSTQSADSFPIFQSISTRSTVSSIKIFELFSGSVVRSSLPNLTSGHPTNLARSTNLQ
ncbi:hypothetical protein H1R20_g8567, partial [Candolleomyces eurysporus]